VRKTASSTDAELLRKIEPLAARGWVAVRIARAHRSTVKRVRALLGDKLAPEPPRRPSGFALLSAKRLREISRLGGHAAHESGTAHEFTKEEARAAGRIGGARNAKRIRQAKKARSTSL
jgi:hypothetical protein